MTFLISGQSDNLIISQHKNNQLHKSFKSQNNKRTNCEIDNDKNKKKKAIIISTAVSVPVVTLGIIYGIKFYKKTNIYNDLPCVMQKKEFLSTLKTKKRENYQKTIDNMEKGIFQLDLHSHSNHSDGYAKVEDILNQACEYGNKIYNKTGNKFIFALTDHDSVEGVEQALKIIRKDPEKFKNIRFVPGVELSFNILDKDNKIKSGELLIHCINPNDERIRSLTSKTKNNRKIMIDKIIEELGVCFSINELKKYFLKDNYETFAYNLHLRVHNYAQIKNRVINMAKEQNCEPNKLFEKLMQKYIFDTNGKRKIQKPNITYQGFDKYLKENKIKTITKAFDEEIENKCQKYSPKVVDGKIVESSENNFEKIIETLKDDKNLAIGFAHPYFFAKDLVNPKETLTYMVKNSKGLIKTTEKFHMAYSNSINKSKIEEYNKILDDLNLIPLGGYDNHKVKFI